MYIFDRVRAHVEKGVVTRLEFLVGEEFAPFKEAKKVADPAFLAGQLDQVAGLVAQGGSGEVLLTSGDSKLRGFQGGYIHLVHIDGHDYLISPRRGADAPSSKLQLDIHAGRMRSRDEGKWPHVLARYGCEVGYRMGDSLFVPQFDQLGNSPLSAALYASVHQAVRRLPDSYLPTSLAIQRADAQDRTPTSAPLFVVDNGSEQYSFRALWCAMPWVSSIEAVRVLQTTVPGNASDLSLYDLNSFGGQPVDRDVYMTLLHPGETGDGATEVYRSGRLQQTQALWMLLRQNCDEQMAMAGRRELGTSSVVGPVSPKLRVVAEHAFTGEVHRALAEAQYVPRDYVMPAQE